MPCFTRRFRFPKQWIDLCLLLTQALAEICSDLFSWSLYILFAKSLWDENIDLKRHSSKTLAGTNFFRRSNNLLLIKPQDLASVIFMISLSEILIKLVITQINYNKNLSKWFSQFIKGYVLKCVYWLRQKILLFRYKSMNLSFETIFTIALPAK